MESPTLQELVDLYDQIQSAQREKMSSLKVVVNNSDEPTIRALLDDAGYDPIESIASPFVPEGQMFIIDLDHVPVPEWEFDDPFTPDWRKKIMRNLRNSMKKIIIDTN